MKKGHPLDQIDDREAVLTLGNLGIIESIFIVTIEMYHSIEYKDIAESSAHLIY